MFRSVRQYLAVLLCCALATIGLTAGLAPVVGQVKVTGVKPVHDWRGSFANREDELLMKAAPKSGFIADEKTWAALCKSWRLDAKTLGVDFQKQMVLVAVTPGARNHFVDVRLTLSEQGDLSWWYGATEIGGPGFAYMLLVVDRAGVKTFNGDPLPKPKTNPTDALRMRLIPKQDTYVLDLGGKTEAEFRKMLDAINPIKDIGAVPPGPRVDLVLEITNTGDQDVTIWIGGDDTSLSFDLQGPGAISKLITLATTADLKFSHPVVIRAGQTFTRPVTGLGFPYPRPHSGWYWTRPGDYTLTATWNTGGPGKRSGVTLVTEPVKLRVVTGAPPVRMIPGVEVDGFGKRGTVISSEAELARYFDAKVRDQVVSQVDFSREKVLWVTWRGSSSSSLRFRTVEENGKVKVVLWTHTSSPALMDLRMHGRLIVMPKDAAWEFGSRVELKPVLVK
jgi:hypothetical protein